MLCYEYFFIKLVRRGPYACSKVVDPLSYYNAVKLGMFLEGVPKNAKNFLKKDWREMELWQIKKIQGIKSQQNL